MMSITRQPSVRVEPAPSVRLSISSSVDIPTGRLGFVVALRKDRLTVAEIQKVVAQHYKLSRDEMLSQRCSRDVARPRQVSMWLCKKLTTRSYPDIGRRHGGRDHTTVLHAFRRIEELQEVDPVIAYDCAFLVAQLGGVPA